MRRGKDKIYNFKNDKKARKVAITIATLIVMIIILAVVVIKKEIDYKMLAENGYNNAFYQLVEYVDKTEVLLAKSTISSSPKHGAKTLSNIWRDATLAQSYLARLPIGTQELESTEKFLNQVADYSYSLANKTIKGDELSSEELETLSKLHGYSKSLKNTLNQLETDLYGGNIKWGDLAKKGSEALALEASNLSQNSFGSIGAELDGYSGLIYDGAFSEHMTNPERVGLTGEDINEEEAKNIAIRFIGEDKIKEINSNGKSQNGNIECYSFSAKTPEESEYAISVSEKGGHIVSMNSNREITSEQISQEDAVKIAREYLEKKEFKNMKETYYMKMGEILTINFAYEQNEITMYPDLVKVKIALDNGEILGLESTGYLNSHKDVRKLAEAKISIDEARKKVNTKLQIKSEGISVIPTEWNTEVLCYEFKGNTGENDFIVYINAETGEEENILMIINTPEGTLTE